MPIKVKSTKIHDDGLPTEKTVVETKPEECNILVVAPPGWGKTELLSTFPDSLLLCFESGHKFSKAYKVIIDCWDFKGKIKEPWTDEYNQRHMSFMQAITLLKESTRFKFIGIDTADSMIKMCLDHFYGVHKVDHASEIGDYGKGWDIAQNTPIRRAFSELFKTGRGVGITTHEEIANRQFKNGTQSKKETTLPNGIWKFLFGQVDIILHGTYGKRIKGSKKRQRLIVTEGSEDILAKNRGGKMPPIYISDEGKQFQQFSGFFINPKTIEIEHQRYLKAYDKEE